MADLKIRFDEMLARLRGQAALPTAVVHPCGVDALVGAVEAAMRGRTTIVIAHRLSTIQKANRILVLSDGQIVEQGSFAELLSGDGFFSYLYNLQAWRKQAAEA